MSVVDLPVADPTRAREHVTLPIEEFAIELGRFMADVEDKGTRAALIYMMAAPKQHMAWAEVMEEGRERRARLYAGQLRALLQSIGLPR